jgi:filamentous hemagglutinin family protein
MRMNMISDVDRSDQGRWVASLLVATMTVLATLGCLSTMPALANPLGPQVVNGQASFAQQGNTLAITNSPNAIINWQSFSIHSGEITRFIQQNPNSSVLNRIVGQDPSLILGALQSNGRVFLINPNGIFFGQGARVDVNGLVASTLSLSNQDFLAGKMNFTAGGKSAGIQNQGAITTPNGGQVYLIAADVQNSGIITSPRGDIVLAAGHTVQLVDSANPDLHVVVSANESKAVNVGQIIAQGGKIGIYGALISQRGIVSADSLVVGENGKIVFKASRDTLLEGGSRTSATGAGKGGDIRILGERVALTGDAKVDVSGNAGGGTVIVGGDYQGRNTSIQNAQQSYVRRCADHSGRDAKRRRRQGDRLVG